MDLYLMQHGEAVDESADPRRPLTAAGRDAVGRVAVHAAEHGVAVDRVVHSGKLRAEQSAEVLATALGCPVVEAVEGLAPGDPVQEFAAALLDPSSPERLAVVGHLPFLDRLASWLVAGDESGSVVAFRNGGLVALRGEEGWSLAWALTPELAQPRHA